MTAIHNVMRNAAYRSNDPASFSALCDRRNWVAGIGRIGDHFSAIFSSSSFQHLGTFVL